MTPTAMTAATPARRLANTNFGLVDGGGGGSGSRSGISASLLRSSTAATSPTNAARCFGRFQGGSADSSAGLCGPASPFAGAPAELASGSGGRDFFGAYCTGPSPDGPLEGSRIGALIIPSRAISGSYQQPSPGRTSDTK